MKEALPQNSDSAIVKTCKAEVMLDKLLADRVFFDSEEGNANIVATPKDKKTGPSAISRFPV
jgi:hypothetical protein